METLQQDQDSASQPATDGEPDLADDGNAFEEAQGARAGSVRHEYRIDLQLEPMADNEREGCLQRKTQRRARPVGLRSYESQSIMPLMRMQ